MKRFFGFCYSGPPISENTLQKNKFIKEVYGVQVDGLHYVCFVLFKRSSIPGISVPTAPYAYGLLPSTIMADLIPGRDYRIAVYNTCVSNDDPVLEMLKRPSMDKWFWHSSGKKE